MMVDNSLLERLPETLLVLLLVGEGSDGRGGSAGHGGVDSGVLWGDGHAVVAGVLARAAAGLDVVGSGGGVHCGDVVCVCGGVGRRDYCLVWRVRSVRIDRSSTRE